MIDVSNLPRICRKLARRDNRLAGSLSQYGPPPLWARTPGFATLLQMILEQQVSLASARACFDKLCERVVELTPESLINSTDAELRADGFSRQKAAYGRHLAQAVAENRIDLNGLDSLSDADVKSRLTMLKGVGEWTSDIYLLMALGRPDVMPKGDIGLHSAWQKLSGGPLPNSDEFLRIADAWRPYRSVAARMLWHFYLSERKKGPG